MKNRKLEKGELGFLIVLLCFGCFAFVASVMMFLKNTKWDSMGAFPFIVTSIMLITGIIMYLQMRKNDAVFEKGTALVERIKQTIQFMFPGKVSIVILYVVIYAVLMRFVGFAISTYLFLAAAMITLKPNKIVRSLIISLGILIFILVVFQFVFQVVLP